MIRDDASERQIQAANPDLSTWLSANAGSGKTRVLTDRVARLLLEDVPPQNILCLTYTKAAAAEMQNRLFERLGEWAMKDDAALIEALGKLGVGNPGELNRARRLFARAIETPGGLKIQTIHSFCSSLLRRFPLESGISPQFTEMDERAAKILRDQIVENMADGPDRDLVAEVARFYSGEDFSSLTQEIANKRRALCKARTADEIWRWFGLTPQFDQNALFTMAFAPGDGDMLKALLPLLEKGSKTETVAATKLRGVDPDRFSISRLEVLESVFLFGSGAKQPFGAKIGSFPTKALREGAALALMPVLEDMMGRIEQARDQRIRLICAEKSLALHRFAARFLEHYEARKLRRGWLDFDDLIQKAAQLLADPAVSAWVLYRLEGMIDHVLVDEAQDTSPVQWQVIDRLTQDFTSGEGARPEVVRTIFVVGDQKQSIYSFQGADPAEFSHMRDRFAQGLKRVGKHLQNLQLEYSFRSSSAILNLVDHCLDARPGLGDAFKHRAFFSDKPGRVDLWPVFEKAQFEEDRSWYDPVDRPMPENHNIRLADAVADDIAEKLKTGSIVGEKKGFRPIQPGDILILVRKRSGGLFDGIIRACKERGLPIAGADRLRIGGELAVRDLTALLRFLATPEDDLSLAAALRSPLFGLDEGALYDLAQPRGKGVYLWSALSDAAENHPKTYSVLRALRDDADFLRPYDLLERVLTRHGGRMNLLARLGPEAEDGIDALLTQALAYERMETPSLTGFLMWLDAEDVTIKRQVDQAGNQIRVMTVHGAKGLESPIVYLPDTAKSQSRQRDELVKIGDGQIAWKPPAALTPDVIEKSLTRAKAREQEEWVRLLYVAMTRAEQWLIIGAAGDVGVGDDSWYSILQDGMETAGAVGLDFAQGPGKRYETGTWVHKQPKGAAGPPKSPKSTPEWLTSPLIPPKKVLAPLAPSDLGGAKALPGDTTTTDTETALRRGRQIHRLLEYLPSYKQEKWADIVPGLLGFGEDAAQEDEALALLTEIATILTRPELEFLFSANTLAEVDISASLPELQNARIHGAIDRLVIADTSILAVDFKSNTIVPTRPAETPEGILRQMGAYRAALTQLYPTHQVETAILWTRTAELMPIPNDLVIEVLRRLDVEGPGS